MPNIEDVKKLREMTLVSMIECKKALEESSGDFTNAMEILRKKGKMVADRKAERAVGAGLIEAYVHQGGRVGVLLDLRCETDFVARNEQFKNLAHELTLQIASMKPLYVSPEDIPQDILENEKRIQKEAAGDMKGKPANIIEQIIAGRMEKYYADVCLVRQPYIKNPDIIVKDLINEAIAKLGENIQARKFVRYEI